MCDLSVTREEMLAAVQHIVDSRHSFMYWSLGGSFFLYCLGNTLLIVNDPFTDKNFFYFILNILLCKKLSCSSVWNVIIYFWYLPPKLQYKILCKGEDENDLNYTGADHCGLSAWSWWLVVNSKTKVVHSGRFDLRWKNVSSTCKDLLHISVNLLCNISAFEFALNLV